MIVINLKKIFENSDYTDCNKQKPSVDIIGYSVSTGNLHKEQCLTYTVLFLHLEYKKIIIILVYVNLSGKNNNH